LEHILITLNLNSLKFTIGAEFQQRIAQVCDHIDGKYPARNFGGDKCDGGGGD
jgi:hypothetical protein